jgi:hypothetical protein
VRRSILKGRGALRPSVSASDDRSFGTSKPGEKRIWVGSIVVDCTDLPRMIRFWSEALHYVPARPPAPDGVILRDPTDQGPNLNLSLGREGPLDDYRLHLDLYAWDPQGEVDRLVALGARRVRPAEPGHDFVTLADPDGNLFDVIDIHWPADGSEWYFGKRPSTGGAAVSGA